VTATGSAAAYGAPREQLMSIGEVLARLRPEFPDITISKLRFLEAEGLVEPYRAPSGYRKYTAGHVERLRYVLGAQRDRYLPLRVIREQLAAVERGERVVGLPPAPRSTPPVPAPASPVSAAPAPASPPVRPDFGDARLTRAQLAERSGLSEAGLEDLEQFGLLPPAPNGYYGGEALTVARIAAQLAEFGIEARHLRPYKATADREVGLLAQLVPPLAHQGGHGGRAHALETVHELAALCAQLHAALVRQGLRQMIGT
jgi:DNA-binding transcriptional MerR regulator